MPPFYFPANEVLLHPVPSSLHVSAKNRLCLQVAFSDNYRGYCSKHHLCWSQGAWWCFESADCLVGVAQWQYKTFSDQAFLPGCPPGWGYIGRRQPNLMRNKEIRFRMHQFLLSLVCSPEHITSFSPDSLHIILSTFKICPLGQELPWRQLQ